MKKWMLCVVVVAAMFGTAARAQDFVGDWQGTLEDHRWGTRMVVKVAKSDKRRMVSEALQRYPGLRRLMNASSVTVDGSTLKFSADLMGATYQGKLNADGTSIVGTWTMGGLDTPVTLARATKETAWELPRACPRRRSQ